MKGRLAAVSEAGSAEAGAVLLERDDELNLLVGGLEGPAGIGKSRLLEAAG